LSYSHFCTFDKLNPNSGRQLNIQHGPPEKVVHGSSLHFATNYCPGLPYRNFDERGGADPSASTGIATKSGAE
jgi:hypothetical protein